jgi:hypothetical protein
MKVTSLAVVLLASLFSVSVVNGQLQKYKGTMVTKLGKLETGIIIVNLDGPNNELIEIATSEQTKTKEKGRRTKQTITTSTKLNVAIIESIIIKDTTYYFRDIKYDYNEKYYKNVCVKLIDGTLKCGIFQNARSKGNDDISVKLPNDEFSKLVSIDFDYYKSTLAWHIFAFGDCGTLRSKMEEEKSGYTWNDSASREQRLAMWKSWIQEYNACTIIKE